jgi:hypothetical protein
MNEPAARSDASAAAGARLIVDGLQRITGIGTCFGQTVDSVEVSRAFS